MYQHPSLKKLVVKQQSFLKSHSKDGKDGKDGKDDCCFYGWLPEDEVNDNSWT